MESTLKEKFVIGKITLAVTHMAEMVKYYEKVFQCHFQPFEMQGITFFTGQVGGFSFLFCPNTLAGVKAEQNRHQFDYIVNDLEQLVTKALSVGGSLQSPIEVSPKQKSATLIDPDGNTTVFIQQTN